MLDRAVRSLRKHGVFPTAGKAVSACLETVIHPRHLSSHLRVPLEMIRHPEHIHHWVADRFRTSRALDQGVPWLAWPCVDYLSEYVTPQHKVFEWGGGGSTVFFLKKGCALTTIESNEGWRDQLRAGIDSENSTRWDLRFVPADSSNAPGQQDYINSVSSGGPWDVVLVDGWNRPECAARAREWVRPGGILVFDNTDKPKYSSVPELFAGWTRKEFRGLGPARSWTTKTDVYIKPKALDLSSARTS